MKRWWAFPVSIGALVAAIWLSPFQASALAGAAACGSGTHGSPGYAYAGHASARVASGIRATLTQVRVPSVGAGPPTPILSLIHI